MSSFIHQNLKTDTRITKSCRFKLLEFSVEDQGARNPDASQLKSVPSLTVSCLLKLENASSVALTRRSMELIVSPIVNQMKYFQTVLAYARMATRNYTILASSFVV